MPKMGDVPRWTIWLMSLAIAAMFTLLITQDAVHRKEIKELQEYANAIQSLRNDEQTGFRKELAEVYERIQTLTEALYERSHKNQN